jgi:diphthine synthase
MLIFVGLGLSRGGISMRGIEVARVADAVYAELYTSIVPGLRLSDLESEIGKKVNVVGRKTLEEQPGEILEAAEAGDVVLLVPGDPMMATTHTDLRLRAERRGIRTGVIHAASIMSAAAGMAGLQSYKFGPSATVPFPDNPSTRPYEVLAGNRERGLHTMLLLDLRADEGRAMTANEAISIMLGLEERLRKGAFTPDTLAVVVARAGSDDAIVRAGRADRLREIDFGPPPHVLLVPGELHFVEAEALKVLAGAPREGAAWIQNLP